jgi:hypothetical protein
MVNSLARARHRKRAPAQSCRLTNPNGRLPPTRRARNTQEQRRRAPRPANVRLLGRNFGRQTSTSADACRRPSSAGA